MKFNSIISRYLFKEMLPPFAINMAFFIFGFMMAKILDIANLIVKYSIGVTTAGLSFKERVFFALQLS